MQLKKHIIFPLLFIAFLISNSAFSSSFIKINFPGTEGKIATVWTYKDLVSLSREIVTTVKVDNDGNINFKTYNKSIKNYYVEIRYLRISFLVEPNTQYQVDVAPVDLNNRDLYPKGVVGYLSPNYNIKIKDKEGPELNYELDSLKIIFDDFINENHLALTRGQNSRKLVIDVEAKANKYLSHHPNPYLKDYVEIQMAQFKKLSRLYGDDYIVKTYFAKDKIAYNNPAYMSYFNSFWTKYIDTRMRNNIRKRLDSTINVAQSYQTLSALVADDPLLADDNLRELVILRNIPQLWNRKGISHKALIDILYDISRSNNNAIHKQIAINMRRRFEETELYDFKFVDSKGDSISLNAQEGKFVYIQIFDDECIECLAQMNYTKELYEEFDDIITFVHISVDRSKEDMLNVIKGKEYPWHFVFLEDNYNFIQEYQVHVVPQAILIDKDGSAINLNAILPSDYFKDSFLKMLNDRKGNLNQQNNPYDGIRVRQ